MLFREKIAESKAYASGAKEQIEFRQLGSSVIGAGASALHLHIAAIHFKLELQVDTGAADSVLAGEGVELIKWVRLTDSVNRKIIDDVKGFHLRTGLQAAMGGLPYADHASVAGSQSNQALTQYFTFPFSGGGDGCRLLGFEDDDLLLPLAAVYESGLLEIKWAAGLEDFSDMAGGTLDSASISVFVDLVPKQKLVCGIPLIYRSLTHNNENAFKPTILGERIHTLTVDNGDRDHSDYSDISIDRRAANYLDEIDPAHLMQSWNAVAARDEDQREDPAAPPFIPLWHNAPRSQGGSIFATMGRPRLRQIEYTLTQTHNAQQEGFSVELDPTAEYVTSLIEKGTDIFERADALSVKLAKGGPQKYASLSEEKQRIASRFMPHVVGLR